MLDIKGGKSTPSVCLDEVNRVFSIEGHSYPENSSVFYKPVINWIKSYLEEEDTEFNLDIKLLYINTSSTKAMFYIFEILEAAFSAGKKVKINWLYDKDNEMARETGEELLEDFTLPHELLAV